jgi:hypothetical protein
MHICLYEIILIVPAGNRGNACILGYKAPARVTVSVWRVSNPSQAMFTLSPKQRAAVET